MSLADSALDPAALARARALVSPAPRRERIWPVLAAAAFAATAALALAGAMITAPPVVTHSALSAAPSEDDGFMPLEMEPVPPLTEGDLTTGDLAAGDLPGERAAAAVDR